jgi:hypothetical protein
MLTAAEWEALVKMCLQLTRGGYPAPHNIMKDIGEHIRSERVASINIYVSILVMYPPLGLHWTTNAIYWHNNFRSVVSQQLDLI